MKLNITVALLSFATTLTPFIAEAKSTAVRKKDPVSVNVHAAARSDHLLRYGVSLGYSVAKRLELSALLLGGQEALSPSLSLPNGMTTSKATGLTLQGSMNGRLFLGESFSILLGAGYRQLKVDYTLSETGSERSASANYMLEDAVGIVGMGHHWAIKGGLNFGVDWGLLSVPYKKQTSVEIKTNGLTDDEAAQVDSATSADVEKINKSKSISLGVVTIGFRF